MAMMNRDQGWLCMQMRGGGGREVMYGEEYIKEDNDAKEENYKIYIGDDDRGDGNGGVKKEE